METSEAPPIHNGKNRKWSTIWKQAISQPSLESYQDLLLEEDRSLQRSATWVVGASILSILVQVPVILTQSQNSDVEIVGSPLLLLCCAPAAIVIWLILYMIAQLVLYGIARVLEGTGEYKDQLWLTTALFAPLSIVNTILSYVNLIPVVGFAINIGFVFYVLLATIISVNAVHGFGWIRAVVAFFLPGLLLFTVMLGVTLLGILL